MIKIGQWEIGLDKAGLRIVGSIEIAGSKNSVDLRISKSGKDVVWSLLIGGHTNEKTDELPF